MYESEYSLYVRAMQAKEQVTMLEAELRNLRELLWKVQGFIRRFNGPEDVYHDIAQTLLLLIREALGKE